MQQREQFLAEFMRRLREAPPGTRVYMRVGDAFKDAEVGQSVHTASFGAGPRMHSPAVNAYKGRANDDERAQALVDLEDWLKGRRD